MTINIVGTATSVGNDYDKAVGTANKDNKLSYQEFLEYMKRNNPSLTEDIIKILFDATSAEGFILITEDNLAHLKTLAQSIDRLLSSFGDAPIASFFTACCLALGVKESAMTDVMKGLSGSDLASTLSATNRVQTMSSIMTQILKLNSMFADKLESAASPR